MNNPYHPTPVFGEVWKQILESKNLRELDTAARQIGRILNPWHQKELSGLYISMKANLTKAKDKNVLPE